eukprot:TRINITY_DN2687_c3_g1_i1.p1 TRINITY_DN2687_c3_g1~~TRINITY_DN2687_c3_g1_i1.p1  ORF type:complete len:692 (+),score=97.09 TRINITY_DN2687_c3_g1_i1:56-2131(+)
MSDWRQERKQRIERTLSESRGCLSDLLDTIQRNNRNKQALNSAHNCNGVGEDAVRKRNRCPDKRTALSEITPPLNKGVINIRKSSIHVEVDAKTKFTTKNTSSCSSTLLNSDIETTEIEFDVPAINNINNRNNQVVRTLPIPKRSEHVQRIIDRSLGDDLKSKTNTTTALERANNILYKNVNAVLGSVSPPPVQSPSFHMSSVQPLSASPVVSPPSTRRSRDLDERSYSDDHNRYSSTSTPRDRLNTTTTSTPTDSGRKVVRTSSAPASARYSPWKQLSESRKTETLKVDVCSNQRRDSKVRESFLNTSINSIRTASPSRKFVRSASAPAAARKGSSKGQLTPIGRVRNTSTHASLPRREIRKVSSPRPRCSSSESQQSRRTTTRTSSAPARAGCPPSRHLLERSYEVPDTRRSGRRRSGSLSTQFAGVEKNTAVYNPNHKSSPTSRRVLKRSDSHGPPPLRFGACSEVSNPPSKVSELPLASATRKNGGDPIEEHEERDPLQRFRNYVRSKSIRDITFGSPEGESHSNTKPNRLASVAISPSTLPVSPPPQIRSTFLREMSTTPPIRSAERSHSRNRTAVRQVSPPPLPAADMCESPPPNTESSFFRSSTFEKSPPRLQPEVVESILVSPLAQSRGPRQLSPEVVVSPTTCPNPHKTSPSPPRELQSYKISRAFTSTSSATDDDDDDGFF